MSEKKYLGDGCYADMDGRDIVLTTENGVDVTNTVYLEPETFRALVRFGARFVEVSDCASATPGDDK